MAQSGNGIDIAAVYNLLSEVAQTVRAHDAEFGRIGAEFGRIGDEFGRISAEFGRINRRLDDLGAGVADLRAAVTEYHATVVGHGILYSELEQRVRRIERHLKLEPAGE